MAEGDETNAAPQPPNQPPQPPIQPPPNQPPNQPPAGGTQPAGGGQPTAPNAPDAPPHPDKDTDLDVFASRGQIIALAVYLMVLTIGLFTGIVMYWPSCDTETGQSQSANVNNNAGGNTNHNANENRSAANNNNANRGGNNNAANNNSGNANSGGNTNNNNASGGNNNAGGNTNGGSPNTNSTPTQNSNRAAPTGPPDIDSVTPQSGPTTGGTSATIKGKNLDGVAVSFGGAPATVTSPGGTSLSVKTPPHEAGKVEVKVERDNVSDSLPEGFTYSSPLCGNLFLVVIFAGALGGTAHALRSLFWYVGNKELKESWLLMYVLLPFSGATVAMIFYLIILGGFRILDVQGGSTPFTAVAVAALVGLFSQQAALKLRDIANAVLTKPGEGDDSRPQKSKSVNDPGANGSAGGGGPKVTPPSGKAGDKVSITGTGLTSVASVKFGDAVVKPITFDKATGTISVTVPPKPAGKDEVVVTITDDAGKSVPVPFKYTA